MVGTSTLYAHVTHPTDSFQDYDQGQLFVSRLGAFIKQAQAGSCVLSISL